MKIGIGKVNSFRTIAISPIREGRSLVWLVIVCEFLYDMRVVMFISSGFIN
jgi:hypothetical protein